MISNVISDEAYEISRVSDPSVFPDARVEELHVESHNQIHGVIKCTNHVTLQWRIQDGAFGANAPPPPPLQEIAYKIEIL